uniref:Uncharacterized protein n=1 Tax=Arundo donax TaxID=35708 RepID=A0A0A9ANY6_ARUDO
MCICIASTIEGEALIADHTIHDTEQSIIIRHTEPLLRTENTLSSTKKLN